KRDSGDSDDFLSGAEAFRAARRDGDDAVRQDSGCGAEQGSGGRVADSRRATAFLAEGIASRGGPGAMVAGTDRVALAAGRERDSPETGRGFGPTGFARHSRKRFVRAGASRGGAELCAAVCA